MVELKYRKNGETKSIGLTETPTLPCCGVKVGEKNYYAALVPPESSDIKVRKGGVTYGLGREILQEGIRDTKVFHYVPIFIMGDCNSIGEGKYRVEVIHYEYDSGINAWDGWKLETIFDLGVPDGKMYSLNTSKNSPYHEIEVCFQVYSNQYQVLQVGGAFFHPNEYSIHTIGEIKTEQWGLGLHKAYLAGGGLVAVNYRDPGGGDLYTYILDHNGIKYAKFLAHDESDLYYYYNRVLDEPKVYWVGNKGKWRCSPDWEERKWSTYCYIKVRLLEVNKSLYLFASLSDRLHIYKLNGEVWSLIDTVLGRVAVDFEPVISFDNTPGFIGTSDGSDWIRAYKESGSWHTEHFTKGWELKADSFYSQTGGSMILGIYKTYEPPGSKNLYFKRYHQGEWQVSPCFKGRQWNY